MSLSIPVRCEWPFFTYGAFQPGELCYQRLANHLTGTATPDRVRGGLAIRDGLPLLDPQYSGDTTEGFVLTFRPTERHVAYAEIAAFEPEELYRWETTLTERRVEVNLLMLLSSKPGSLSARIRESTNSWIRRAPLVTREK